MTQAEMVLKYCEEHGSITSLDAIRDIGCTRLAAQIFNLEHNDGHLFSRQSETSRNRYGKYVTYTRYTLVK